jgi:hypothetical protein
MFKGEKQHLSLICHWDWVWMVKATLRQFILEEKIPVSHCKGDWVGPRAVLDECKKSRLHRDSNPVPSDP